MDINLPTQLTLGRVAAIPALVIVFFLPDFTSVSEPLSRALSCALFAAAAITDIFDGYLARRMNLTSPFGAFLDPVADKLIVAVALILLLQADPRVALLLPVLVIIGREITISALREWMAELGKRTSVAVNWVGKFKTITQMVAISFMLFHNPLLGLPIYEIGFVLLLISAVLTVWSMVMYLKAAWPVLSGEIHVKS